MQIYANIFNREIQVTSSAETVATGAAIMGGYCALKGQTGYENLQQMQQRICKIGKVYRPEAQDTETYQILYGLYKELHDVFGISGNSGRLHHIMKELLQLKNQ
jgi:L-ribulokinase